ncbi:Serine/threonine-protein kinase [Rhypophila decipiens]|uniref:Serine/threonine-protein kinase n=1 Tax=Rhypophila decipiens TaxID=261697 RepID=A0AAN7B3J9_9PEZI|nr:Serine/threonine-protein kinase [Rhypophila decipiens]
MKPFRYLPRLRLVPRRVRPRRIPTQSYLAVSPPNLAANRVPKVRLFSSTSFSTSNWGPSYGPIEDVEGLYGYQPGGHHPLNINDLVHDRYRVVHKLGHGSFSTIWLALDESSADARYVAIKVCTAEYDGGEVNILRQLRRSPGIGESFWVPKILHHFGIDGPNGRHECIVTPPARCSLRDAREASSRWLFPLDVARSMAAQLAMAVQVVHEWGWVHGDIHFGNILLQMPASLNHLTVQQLYEQFGAPDPQPVLLLKETGEETRQSDSESPPLPTGVPSYAIPPIWLGKSGDDLSLSETKIILTDFGVAFRPEDKSRFESYTPLVSRPPEALFEPTVPLSFASDIWSLGCVIFEIMGHRSLIDGILATQNRVTTQHVHLLGKPPAEWWAKWQSREKHFDDDGTPRDKESDIWNWERRFEGWVQSPRRDFGMEVMGQEEAHAFMDMLKTMVVWRPEERPTAEDFMDMEWMKKWAIPAYEEGIKRMCKS